MFVLATSVFAQTTADEWFKKACEYFDKGDYANAITAYSEAIKRGSTNLNAYFVRGIAYLQVKNYDAAIADCDTVIKGEPDFSRVYVVRGDAYGAKGVYHKAVTDFKTGLEKGYDPSGFSVDKSSKADMWFCGAMYMEIAVNRFLGKSDVVAKYENWLKTVSDKNKVTRAEIEKFYRDNVRSLIAAVVDEEFNKVWTPFLDRVPNVTLARNPKNGQYTLRYWKPGTGDMIITTNSLDLLLSEMRNGTNRADFTPAGLDAVRSMADVIPAVYYEKNNLRILSLVMDRIVNFFQTPNQANYNLVKSIYIDFNNEAANSPDSILFKAEWNSLRNTLRNLPYNLTEKIESEVTRR